MVNKPKYQRKKYKQVKVNFSIDDHLLIQEKANEKGMKLSSFLRYSLLESNLINEKRKDDKPKEQKGKIVDPNLLRELNMIGNNFNQISKKLNIKRAIDFKILEEMEMIENHLQQIKKEYL